MRSRVIVVGLVVHLLPVAASHAAAQTPVQFVVSSQKAPVREVFLAGTSQLEPDVNLRPDCDRLSLPCVSGKSSKDNGVSLVYARRLTESVSLTAEAAEYDIAWQSSDAMTGTRPETNRVRSLMIGPRVSTPFRSDPRGRSPFELRGFAQVILGVQGSTTEKTEPAIRPGVGLDVRLGLGALLRLEIDQTVMLKPTQRTIDGPRLLLAIGYGFGSR